ncbi:hypothetical protein O1611_g742 [Lasiodiplodia mahajangana]|uniref:Uncharacterized protein n=1 Tax=Lasiodiplodia mahajangana TaxID=1108764 RepID=A0ACC2JZY5_9PEZI|nr:hypothetical protein O1611_g742 [Lasiodiplodia mahajangana]
MPTSDSFSYHDEEQLVPDEYPFHMDFDGTNDTSTLAKDTLGSFMDLQASDGDSATIFDLGAYGSDGPQQPGQPPFAAVKPNHHLPSHRGSTSSSSSLRSASSNSPHTSIGAMPMDASPPEWFEDMGGHEDSFSVEDSIDLSQYLTLSGDSSSPGHTIANEPSPELEFHSPRETLPQGRANKRRKAQPRRPTKQSSNRSMDNTTTNGVNGVISPVSTYMASNVSSPNTVYGNGLVSPESNFNNFSDVFGNMSHTGWPSTTNDQIGNPSFPQPGPDSTYIPPSHNDLPNGNPPTSLSHPPMPRLVIHPMPLKSRVETQIPLKITLHNLPKGIKKVHLPTHTISKPKLLQKPSAEPSPDTLELSTMLVCTSAMSDEMRRKRALECAAGKPNINELNSPVDSIEDEENKSQNGGEVRICLGCITRERKRASRKKHKKPEEEELWDRYERERAIVFNTQEVKEWQTVTPLMADPTGAGFINGALPEGTVQVDAPMRIACYCRHHGEKLGFQVIITLKDYIGNIVAQGMSSSIMITDDHKTPAHVGPTPQQPSQSQPQLQHSPQPLATNGLPLPSQPSISQPIPTHTPPIQPRGIQSFTPFQPNSGDTSSLPLRQTHSTSDLQGQGQSLSLVNSSGQHASNSQSISIVATPQSFSRQTSPTTPLGTSNRKRKASMVGKVPVGLAMTQIETSHPLPSMPPTAQNDSTVISAGNSPFSTSITHGPLNGDLTNKGQLHMLNNVSQSLGTGPTTPNNNATEPFMFAGINNRPISMERPVNQLFSAPVSAHPSRAPSPSQLRPDPQNLQLSQRPQDLLSGPPMPAPAILRIIPGEGSKCGGAEITVLGSNFTNDGLEVYFGSQRAITTTYWGPTSLVCMLPPSPVSGPVPVTIKHPGRRQQPPQHQAPSFFTYKDDDEDQLIRSALGVLAGQYGRVVANPADFARSILYAQTSASGSNGQAPHNNSNINFSRFNLEPGEAVESSLLRILEVLDESPEISQLDHPRSSGQTMLHLACSLGFDRFVTGLLSRGANVHIKDKGGFTPLHMAAMNGHPEIVRQLIAQGADRNVQSRSGLKPIDVAMTQPVRRSLQYIENHSRSRSVDSRPSRIASPSPARSLWEPSAMTSIRRPNFPLDVFGTGATSNEDGLSKETTCEEVRDWLGTQRGSFAGLSRRSTVEPHPVDEVDDGPSSPSATMAAIREQVANQLQQFQHTMAMHFQNLPQFQMPNMPQIPKVPPMPVMPDYHAYLQSAPVMQRISSLVPNIRGQRQEPARDQTSSSSDNKWGVFPFFGNKDFPPAYEDIFPPKDLDIKQSSAAQAAAEFEADAKCAALFDQDPPDASQTEEVPALLQIGRKHFITKEQQETLQRAHAQRLKAGSSDKMLWFVWIPILILVLGLMLWSGGPSLVSSVTSGTNTVISLIANPRDVGNRVRYIVQELAY